MKIINFTTLFIVTSLLFLSCTGQSKVDYKGISFSHPPELTVTYNNFVLFKEENIDVEVSYIGSFLFDCVEAFSSRGVETYAERSDFYTQTLEYIRDVGINSDVEELESITCGFAGSNLSSRLINIDGINGVVYHKVTGNSGLPSLSTFFTQALLVGPENQIYSVIFNYEFGELGTYIRSLKDEFGEAILDEDESYKYDEVVKYLKYGNPISDADVAAFEDNQKVIDEIISSIKIEK